MSLIDDIGAAGGFVVGAVKQLLNAAGQRVPVDVMPLPVGPVGDLLDPRGDSQRAGADVMDDVIDALTGTRHQLDPQAARARRPLLATGRVSGSEPGGATSIHFAADAPGCDWSVAERAGQIVAVYVDGRYHSSVVVQRERTGGYTVNLGELAAGLHEVELRAASDLVAPGLPLPTVGALTAQQLTGEQAWIDAHAPVIEMYNTNPGSLRSASANGVPVLMVPAVTRHPDGSKTVEYRVLFTHEEGGTTDPDLLARHGRAVDSEYCYRVTVDARGRITDEQYQSAVHQWKRFTGTRENGRPVLRVSTPNHMFSERAHVNAGDLRERWSIATSPALVGGQSEYTTMLANPWTWQLMAKELRRGGNVAADDAVRGARDIADPTRYVYFEQLPAAVRDAAIGAGYLEVRLRTGAVIQLRAPEGMGVGYFARTAIELPTGVDNDDVLAVTLAGVRALVLTDELMPRELTAA